MWPRPGPWTRPGQDLALCTPVALLLLVVNHHAVGIIWIGDQVRIQLVLAEDGRLGDRLGRPYETPYETPYDGTTPGDAFPPNVTIERCHFGVTGVFGKPTLALAAVSKRIHFTESVLYDGQRAGVRRQQSGAVSGQLLRYSVMTAKNALGDGRPLLLCAHIPGTRTYGCRYENEVQKRPRL